MVLMGVHVILAQEGPFLYKGQLHVLHVILERTGIIMIFTTWGVQIARLDIIHQLRVGGRVKYVLRVRTNLLSGKVHAYHAHPTHIVGCRLQQRQYHVALIHFQLRAQQLALRVP